MNLSGSQRQPQRLRDLSIHQLTRMAEQLRDPDECQQMIERLVAAGDAAVPFLIEVVREQPPAATPENEVTVGDLSLGRRCAAAGLGRLGHRSAVDVLEIGRASCRERV